MKTRTLTFPRLSPGIIAAVVAAAMIVVGAATLIARAETPPAITNAIQNGSNATITSAPIGTAVHNFVTVASTTASTTPTGTVDFNLFANTTCSGTPTTQSGVALVNGSAQSATTTVPDTGLSYTTHYSGDATSTPGTSSCQALTATAASVSINTTLSTSTVLAGSSVYDTATLNNETANATGTVTYTVYTNNLCTAGAQSAGAKTVASGVVPNSDTLLFNTPGTYYWQAVYSGDQFNSSATSACQSEILTVQATSTPPPPPPPATTTPGTISGTVYNDANGNDVKDGGESGLSGWKVWLHFGTKKDGYNDPIIQTATTDANGHYSFSNLAFGKYFVEEEEQNGWNQTSSDMKVVLSTTTTGALVDFANMMKSATTTGHGKHRCDGDDDDDDIGCTATTTPFRIHTSGDGFFNGLWGHFKFSFKSKNHDNGNHFGQIKNGNKGKHSGKDNDD